MADPRGFLKVGREGPERRPVAERVRDWREVYRPFPKDKLRAQASRCMDCGIPFCHEGCPLGNLIPDWNDLTWRDRLDDASERLHATNNFPEFTGRLCPAPCEAACVLGIASDPVTIKQVEYELAEWAAGRGLAPVVPSAPTGRSVAVVGSGPAGLAAAQQLTRAGHRVVVFERAERIGGLLRYGVPEFKLEKAVIDRRLAQMVAEGTELRVRTAVGEGARGEVPGAAAADATVVPAERLVESFDAVVLAIGATRPRDLAVPGRQLRGVHFAMEYLKGANLTCEGTRETPPISAAGRHVVIIGGGDTGADCLGTVHRQGAASVHQLEILPEPPTTRPPETPWPTWPAILRLAAAHEEGGERLYSVATSELVDDGTGAVGALRAERVERQVVDGRPAFVPVPGGALELRAELVLLALGFLGPERTGVVAELGLELDERGTIAVDGSFMTSRPGVFACGDAARGQSLVVWAIAEGRSAAAAVDRYLTGSSDLPAPLRPGARALA
ncbi:MAG TPA: glutamate synthase subunit beta [Acidimicrobiales bacterium]|nr:glutamate synthase subunit beta [Acidimicrobiales bacterium]